MQSNSREVETLEAGTTVYIVPNLEECNVNSPGQDQDTDYQTFINLVSLPEPSVTFRDVEKILPRLLEGDAMLFCNQGEAMLFMDKYPEDYHFLLEAKLLTSIKVLGENIQGLKENAKKPCESLKHILAFTECFELNNAMKLSVMLKGKKGTKEIETAKTKFLDFSKKNECIRKDKAKAFFSVMKAMKNDKTISFPVPRPIMHMILKQAGLFSSFEKKDPNKIEKMKNKNCVIF